MGFKIQGSPVPEAEQDSLWRKYRDQFPVTGNLVYLNHASVAPLCRPSAEAMQRLAQDVCAFGSLHYQEWVECYQGLRDAAARMIHSRPDEIAIVKNTSEGVSAVAQGIDWKAGDRVVAFLEEFPANSLPWRRLENKGVTVEWLPLRAPLEQIDEACRGARLLAISFIQYLGGRRADLRAIGEICHRRGAIFFVDAIQGLGAFPVDVADAHIDALSADGHKWLLGPEGCGILYISKEIQDQIEPVEFGWTNVADFANYGNTGLRLRPDAGRYECGTLNTIGCFGLRASFEFLLEIGVERIAREVEALADRIADGVVRKGYELLEQRTRETASGIVSFRRTGLDSANVVKRLLKAGVAVAPRQGWIRASPHFYIAPAEIDQMLDGLP